MEKKNIKQVNKMLFYFLCNSKNNLDLSFIKKTTRKNKIVKPWEVYEISPIEVRKDIKNLSKTIFTSFKLIKIFIIYMV